MRSRTTIAPLVLALFCIFPALSEDATDTLTPEKNKYFDEVLINPELDSFEFSRVFVTLPLVSFAEAWERKHLKKIKDDYQVVTISRYSELFKAQIESELVETGRYVLSERRDESGNLLVIEPMIIDLDVYAPEYKRRTEQYVRKAGNVTLAANVLSGEGVVLAKFMDNRDTRTYGFDSQEEADEVFNQREFKRLMKTWSERMIERLEKGVD